MDQGATLGGVIATNLGGDERLDLGAPRDNVLGIEYVNGNGELLRAGGRVMKNVTGLDMGRAFGRKLGTLGYFDGNRAQGCACGPNAGSSVCD